MTTYQFIHKLKEVKNKLKAWNKLRAKENSISKLQEQLAIVFSQSDEDPESEELFELMSQCSK